MCDSWPDRSNSLMAFPFLDHPHHVHDVPKLLRHSGLHGWRATQRTMDATEVVSHEMQCDRVRVVLCLLAEGVGQSCEPAHVHPHGKVLALDMRRADAAHIGPAGDDLLV